MARLRVVADVPHCARCASGLLHGGCYAACYRAPQVENSIANMKQDVVESNSDFRRRLARLEHDLAAVRDEQAARK